MSWPAEKCDPRLNNHTLRTVDFDRLAEWDIYTWGCRRCSQSFKVPRRLTKVVISQELLPLFQGSHCSRSGFTCSVCYITERTSIAPMANGSGYRSGGITPSLQTQRIGAKLIFEGGEIYLPKSSICVSGHFEKLLCWWRMQGKVTF